MENSITLDYLGKQVYWTSNIFFFYPKQSSFRSKCGLLHSRCGQKSVWFFK